MIDSIEYPETLNLNDVHCNFSPEHHTQHKPYQNQQKSEQFFLSRGLGSGNCKENNPFAQNVTSDTVYVKHYSSYEY